MLKVSHKAPSGGELSTRVQSIIFVTPLIGFFFLQMPIVSVLSGIYAKHFGLQLSDIATAVLIAKLLDAITDPLVGYYSDRQKATTGSRKPLIFWGGLLVIPCCYCLFVPSMAVGVGYFILWYAAYYLAYTFFTVPYMAWANEITTHTDEKNFLFGIWGVAVSVGGILFYALPFLPFLLSTDINPAVLKVAFWVGLAVFMPCLFWVLYRVPNGRESPVESASSFVAESANGRLASFVAQLSTTAKSLLRNQPFVLYGLIMTAFFLALGMWTGLLFIFIDGYLKLGEAFAGVSMLASLFAIVCIPIWYRLSKIWSKQLIWRLNFLLAGLGLIAFSVLTPGQGSLLPAVMGIFLWLTFAGSASFIASPILCDIIDYGRWRESIDRGGLYFALNALLQKAQLAVGGALGLAILGWAEFDINATAHSALAVTSIKAAVSWLPAMLYLVAFWLAAKLPLHERRMTIIRRRLAARDQRLLV